jgi:hypothetical protein
VHDKKFLTPAELSARWDGRITVRTLANWRSSQSGPPFVKLGGAILYRITDVEAYEQRNTVTSTSQYRGAAA